MSDPGKEFLAKVRMGENMVTVKQAQTDIKQAIADLHEMLDVLSKKKPKEKCRAETLIGNGRVAICYPAPQKQVETK